MFKSHNPTILQVIPQLRSGGAEKTAIDVAKAVMDHGWHAIIASAGGPLTEQLAEMGIDHVNLPLDSKNPVQIWRSISRLERLIEERQVSLIHARSRAPAWSAYFAARRSGVPFVTTYHGAYSQKNKLKAIYNSVMAKGDVVIANSNWTADLVRSRNPEAAGRLIAIPRGTDFSDFEQSAISEDRVRSQRQIWDVEDEKQIILHLARITPLKDQLTIVRALGLLRERWPNLHVVFAGDDKGHENYTNQLVEQAAKSGVRERVHFPGLCSDPAAAIAASTLVVSASRQPETFGRVAVEAAALGKPVVVTEIGASAETVIARNEAAASEFTGWKVPPCSPEAFASAITEILSMGDAEASELAKRARNHVVPRFSLARMTDATIEVYRRLLLSDSP